MNQPGADAPRLCTMADSCIDLHSRAAAADGRLHQEVAPELAALRQQPSWSTDGLEVSASRAVQVQPVSGPSWYAECTVVRGEAAATGLLLRSWLYKGPEVEVPCAAALLLDWRNNQLEVGVVSLYRMSLTMLA